MYAYSNYNEAKKKAKEMNLIISDYGTIHQNYVKSFFMCWNETGNPFDSPIVYVEYQITNV